MNKMKKVIISAFVFTVLGTGTLGVKAIAMGGGTWNYGVGLTGSYSDYYHATRAHSATVRHGYDFDQVGKKAGSWAKARLTKYSGCSFFWGYTD